MKKAVIILLTVCFTIGCKFQTDMEQSNFKAEKVSKTSSFVVNSNIEKVFPLFGAFEERKWEPNWDPILIFPEKEIIEEGTTFKIMGHGRGSESEYLWIVTKYDISAHLIQYLVSTNNRFWTITVECESIENATKTKTTVVYSYIGLNARGNELNKSNLERMYQQNLQDWADAINNYLQKL